MNQDTNQKKIKPSFVPLSGTTAGKEEKDFLAREEVKTMTKDMSGLREVEARQERERVAKIKTEEEIARDKERQLLAEKAVQERALAEKEAREREERIKKIREEREARQIAENQLNTEKAASVTGEFRGALGETQTREEEARKRFLDRVAAKAEGKEAGPAAPPLPPTPPAVKEEKLPEPPKILLKKPSRGQKLWIRIILSLLGLAILAAAGTFVFWYFYVKNPATGKPEKTNSANPVSEQKTLVVPPALIAIKDSQTLKFSQASEIPSLLSQALQNNKELGSLNRLLLEDTVNVKILGLKEFFDSFKITRPDGFYSKLDNNATLFIYSQEEGERLGLVAKVTDPEGLAEIMTSWESSLEGNLGELFKLFNQKGPALVSYFRDAKYQEVNFRYQTFSRQDTGIVYSIFDDYFILTTSWKSMEKALDKLKEAPVSLFFSPDSGAEFVLDNMTLEGKIGQLFFIGINGTTLTEETAELVKNIQPGGILLLKKNIVDETQTKTLIQDLQQVALKTYGIPLLIGVDQEGGEISPINFAKEKTAQSELETADQAYAVGFDRGEELKALGVNLNLAPVLDTAQPGDFLFNRAFQATSSEASALVKALIAGQKTASILTAVKHFPGYGDIAFNPEKQLATLDETPQVSLFKSAAEAKPEFIMTSNVIYSGIDQDMPFSFSEKGINMLKESIGPDALVMTDDLPQPSLIDKFSLKGVVTLPIKAGADILTFSNNWETTLSASVRILQESVQNEEIPLARINDSVLKIIKLKKSYYHYEPPHQNEFYKK